MARRTKKQDGESVGAYYGINPTTYEVQRVWLTRGGTLSRFNKGGSITSHETAGRRPDTEVGVVFGLWETEYVTQGMFNTDAEKKIVADLEKKATAMKAEANKDPKA